MCRTARIAITCTHTHSSCDRIVKTFDSTASRHCLQAHRCINVSFTTRIAYGKIGKVSICDVVKVYRRIARCAVFDSIHSNDSPSVHCYFSVSLFDLYD